MSVWFVHFWVSFLFSFLWVKGNMLWFSHLENVSLHVNLSSSSFAILLNLFYPTPSSLVWFRLSRPLWCFFSSVNYHFKIFFNLKVICLQTNSKYRVILNWVTIEICSFIKRRKQLFGKLIELVFNIISYSVKSFFRYQCLSRSPLLQSTSSNIEAETGWNWYGRVMLGEIFLSICHVSVCIGSGY